MRLLRALLAFAAMAFALALPLAASALEECNFNFKVTAESSALQVLMERAQNEKGFWQPVREAPEDVQKVAKFVGLLQVCLATPDGKPGTVSGQLTTRTMPSPTVNACTATLLPNNQLLTNHHCFYSPELQALGFKFIQEVRVSFGYLSEDDTSGVKTYRVMNREIDGDEDLDVLLLQIMGGDANADLGGHFPTSMQTEIKPFQELKIIHHPGGAPQRYSSGTCKVHKDQRDLGAEATALRHTCETIGGSSGSLILDGKSLAIVGVHNLGGLGEPARGYNSGHRIAPINKALGLGLEEVQRVTASPKVDPCDPKFALAKQVNQCAVWDGYLASCPSHSKASEARKLKANACKVDACDGQFEKAKASNTCDSWKSYTKACGNHNGMVVAAMAVELTCKPVAEEKPKQPPASTSEPSAETVDGWIKDAEAASKRKNYTKAAELYRNAADAGDACAQLRLGYMHEFVPGITQSVEQAKFWFQKSATQAGDCSLRAQKALDRLTSAAVVTPTAVTRPVPRPNVTNWKTPSTATIADRLKGGDTVTRPVPRPSQRTLKTPSGATVVDWVKSGDAALRRKDYQEAARLYELGAFKGDSCSQLRLAYLYENGYGVNQSVRSAEYWYKQSAARPGKCSAVARLDLANLTKTTAAPYRSAPNSNVATVAGWYESGVTAFMEEKYADAAAWFQKAADKGNSEAKTYLGTMYYYGLGLTQSDAEAVQWYRNAAMDGDAVGQCNLALLMARGRGTAKDPVLAAEWTIRSVKNAQGFCISNMDDGATLSEIQKNLKQRGLYSGAIDGTNGPETQAAMRKLLPN